MIRSKHFIRGVISSGIKTFPGNSVRLTAPTLSVQLKPRDVFINLPDLAIRRPPRRNASLSRFALTVPSLFLVSDPFLDVTAILPAVKIN